MSWNVWNRPSGSFMVDMGISSNIMKYPLPNVTWHSGSWSSTVTPLTDQTLHKFLNLSPTGPYYQCWPYYQISGGVRGILQRLRLANRGRLLLRTPGPVHFGTCICSNIETILSWTCHVYGPFEFRTSLGTSILLKTYCYVMILFPLSCKALDHSLSSSQRGRVV